MSFIRVSDNKIVNLNHITSVVVSKEGDLTVCFDATGHDYFPVQNGYERDLIIKILAEGSGRTEILDKYL